MLLAFWKGFRTVHSKKGGGEGVRGMRLTSVPLPSAQAASYPEPANVLAVLNIIQIYLAPILCFANAASGPES